MRRFLLALAATTALASPALASTVTGECRITDVIDTHKYVTKEAFFNSAHPPEAPIWRKVTLNPDSTVTYEFHGGNTTSITIPIDLEKTKKAQENDKANGEDRNSVIFTSRYGDDVSRWMLVDDKGFLLVTSYRDGTKNGAYASCKWTTLKAPPPAAQNEWRVPLEQYKAGNAVNGQLNSGVDIKWLIDTGATITSIPFDLAIKTGAKVIRKETFVLADGRKID